MAKKKLLNPKIAVTLPPITEKQRREIVEAVYSTVLYCEQANTWAEVLSTKNHGVPDDIPQGNKLYSNEVRDAARRLQIVTKDFVKLIQDTGVDLTGLYEISAQVDDGLRNAIHEQIEANNKEEGV